MGLYPNIPHEDGLVAMGKALDAREGKTVSTDCLTELAECVLKNNIFEHLTLLFTNNLEELPLEPKLIHLMQ